MFHRISINFMLLLRLVNVVSCFMLELMCITLIVNRKAKPHSSLWFSVACAAAIVHRNHFLRLYQQSESYESKVKFRQTSNLCERVLEAAKVRYANKTKESILSQKPGSRDFW